MTSTTDALTALAVDEPVLYARDGWVRVQTRFRIPAYPDAPGGGWLVWFEIPEAHADAVAHPAEAFLVALLPLAMRHGSALAAPTPVSERLLHGLREYQQVLAAWYPHLQAVPVEATPRTGPPDAPPATGTASFFSGGADSFFTLYQHLPEREPVTPYRLTHGLFIHGFDAKVDRDNAFAASFATYQALYDRLGLTLIPVRTNLKAFVNDITVGWRAGHGAFLIATALLLQGALGRVYVPSTSTYWDAFDHPYGSNPVVDHLLGTEMLQVVHDGAWATRVEKLETLAAWPETYDKLYVCFVRQGDGRTNCGRCEKCLRTMVALELVGALDRYNTFPHPLRPRDIRRWRMPYYYMSRAFLHELISYGHTAGRADVVRNLQVARWRHELEDTAAGRWLRRRLIEPARRSPRLSAWLGRRPAS